MRFTTLLQSQRTLAASDMARGDGTTLVAEYVSFRLKNGTDQTAFAQAAGRLEPFLNSTGAVQSRMLSLDDSGTWTDCIVWTSLAAAKDAADKLMQDADAQPFMAMIDPATVNLRHAPILYSMKQEHHASHRQAV